MDDAAGFNSHALMSATHPGAFRWDVSANLVTGDLNLARMFELNEKYARRGVALESFVERVHVADRAIMFRSLAAALERCGVYRAQYRIVRPSGELHVQGIGRCYSLGGARVLSGVVLDITGFLNYRSLDQEESDVDQIVHSCLLARSLALRNGYSEACRALQFALDAVRSRSL